MLKVNCGYQDAPQGQALLVHHGPAIWVDIGFDPGWDPKSNAAPTPGISRVRALIDTGARQSCVDSALAVQLGLPHFDRKPVSSVNGIVMVNFHLAQVHVPSLKFTQRGPFAAVSLNASGFKYEALLGRSFLSYVTMEYDGPSGEVALLFK